MADFSFFKMAAVFHLTFFKVVYFNFRSDASSYQISRRSVKPFRRDASRDNINVKKLQFIHTANGHGLNVYVSVVNNAFL